MAEAEGEEDGRKRPWRAVMADFVFDTGGQGVDTSEAEAQRLLEAAMLERHAEILTQYVRDRESYSPAWRGAASSLQDNLTLTPAQLGSLIEELGKVLSRFRRRQAILGFDEEAERVHVALNAVPWRPGPGNTSGTT